jgi:hypothetical protein
LFCHSSQPDVCSLKADMRHPIFVCNTTSLRHIS